MFLEKIKKIKENVNNNDDPLFWILVGLAVFILLLTFTAKSSIYFLLSLIFLFIFLLPFYIVKKKYKGLNWEKFILCFLFSLIHIFILCFMGGVLIEWIYDFNQEKMGNTILNIFEFLVFLFLILFIIGFAFFSIFIIIPSPFYFVWKKYKKFTKKRIIICSLISLALTGLGFYSWAWSVYFIFYLGLNHIFIVR